MLTIKILGYRKTARYVVRRVVTAAWEVLKTEFPGTEVQFMEVSSASDISKYTPVFVMASLVINEKLVCAGRIPSREEVLAWLRAALTG